MITDQGLCPRLPPLWVRAPPSLCAPKTVDLNPPVPRTPTDSSLPLIARSSRIVGGRHKQRVAGRQSRSTERRSRRPRGVVDAEEGRRPALRRLQPGRLTVTARIGRRRRRQRRDRGASSTVRCGRVRRR